MGTWALQVARAGAPSQLRLGGGAGPRLRGPRGAQGVCGVQGVCGSSRDPLGSAGPFGVCGVRGGTAAGAPGGGREGRGGDFDGVGKLERHVPL